MAARPTVVWDKKAKKAYFQTLEYIAKEFSLQAAENLIEAVEQATAQIVQYPTSFRQSKIDPNVRFILVGPNRRLYYALEGDK